jgi:hypothetical protein
MKSVRVATDADASSYALRREGKGAMLVMNELIGSLLGRISFRPPVVATSHIRSRKG